MAPICFRFQDARFFSPQRPAPPTISGFREKYRQRSSDLQHELRRIASCPLIIQASIDLFYTLQCKSRRYSPKPFLSDPVRWLAASGPRIFRVSWFEGLMLLSCNLPLFRDEAPLLSEIWRRLPEVSTLSGERRSTLPMPRQIMIAFLLNATWLCLICSLLPHGQCV